MKNKFCFKTKYIFQSQRVLNLYDQLTEKYNLSFSVVFKKDIMERNLYLESQNWHEWVLKKPLWLTLIR